MRIAEHLQASAAIRGDRIGNNGFRFQTPTRDHDGLRCSRASDRTSGSCRDGGGAARRTMCRVHAPGISVPRACHVGGWFQRHDRSAIGSVRNRGVRLENGRSREGALLGAPRPVTSLTMRNVHTRSTRHQSRQAPTHVCHRQKSEGKLRRSVVAIDAALRTQPSDFKCWVGCHRRRIGSASKGARRRWPFTANRSSVDQHQTDEGRCRAHGFLPNRIGANA
jgi:hypothetical protein